MKSIQDVYIGQPLAWPQLLAAAGTLTSEYIDISKFPRNMATSLRVVLYICVTDVALTTLKLQGTDDDPTGSPTWHDLVGTRYGTDNDIDGNLLVLPGATSDKTAVGWVINANSGNYRYYRAAAVADAGSTGMNLCIAVEADQSANIMSGMAYATGFTQIAAYPVVQQTTH